MMEGLIRELSEETTKVRFYKVDVDAQQEISKFVGGVHIMPTIFVYKSGQTVNTMAGANPKGLRVCRGASGYLATLSLTLPIFSLLQNMVENLASK